MSHIVRPSLSEANTNLPYSHIVKCIIMLVSPQEGNELKYTELCSVWTLFRVISLCVGGSKVLVVIVYMLQHCTLSGGHVFPFDI